MRAGDGTPPGCAASYVERRGPARADHVELRTRCRPPTEDAPVPGRDDRPRPSDDGSRPDPRVDDDPEPAPVHTPPAPVIRPKGSSMSVLHVLAAPAAAHASVAAGGLDIGSGRLVPTVAAVAGLISVVVGGLALARRGRVGTGNGLAGAVVALVTGLVSAVVGGLHAAGSAGGLGTGNGLAGAVVALALGLTGMVVGGLALARSRRSARMATTAR